MNNAGVMAGFYADSSGIAHGFTFKNGVYTTVDDPLGVQGTAVTGISDSGQIVGFYGDASGNFHVFVDSNGAFTTISDAAPTELLALALMMQVRSSAMTLIAAESSMAFLQHRRSARP